MPPRNSTVRAHKSHEFVSKEATNNSSSNIARQQQQQSHALPHNSNSNSSNFVAEISRAKFNFGFSWALNKSRATFDFFFANLQGKERGNE